MRAIYLLAIALIACGDNKNNAQPDAPDEPDAPPDVAPVVCDYSETDDANNDDLLGTGTAETTNLTFTNAALTICGQINNGHFNVPEEAVDVDSFRLTVPADTLGILHLSAPDASALQSTTVEISGLTTATGVSEVGVLADTFAVTAATLVPGDYLITVSSFNPTDAASAIDYVITLELDSATRCAKATQTADYAESSDGVTADGNDVVEIRFSGSPPRQFTALPTDVPEDTNLTIASDATFRITGTTANPAVQPVSWMDSYTERDTYAITTGATTNTLAVRVNWPGTTTDLDFYVFPESSFNEIAQGFKNGNMEDEFTTLAVTPSTTYWITVAADNASALPANYDLTVCGSTFDVPLSRAAVARRFTGPRAHPVFTRTGRALRRK
jgi:hypothetical protein